MDFYNMIWISHYWPCYAPILVIAQDTWTLKHTNDKKWTGKCMVQSRNNLTTKKQKILCARLIYIFPHQPLTGPFPSSLKMYFHSLIVFFSFPKHASNRLPLTHSTSSPMFVVWVHAWVCVQGKSSETIWFQKVLLKVSRTSSLWEF